MKKYNITVNGTTYEVLVEEVGAGASHTPVYSAPVVNTSAPKAQPQVQSNNAAGGATKVSAPMPGTILDVKVTAGQAVKKGEPVVMIEAMKMETPIPAPQDGTIASINTQQGATVASGDVLVTMN